MEGQVSTQLGTRASSPVYALFFTLPARTSPTIFPHHSTAPHQTAHQTTHQTNGCPSKSLSFYPTASPRHAAVHYHPPQPTTLHSLSTHCPLTACCPLPTHFPTVTSAATNCTTAFSPFLGQPRFDFLSHIFHPPPSPQPSILHLHLRLNLPTHRPNSIRPPY